MHKDNLLLMIIPGHMVIAFGTERFLLMVHYFWPRDPIPKYSTVFNLFNNALHFALKFYFYNHFCYKRYISKSLLTLWLLLSHFVAMIPAGMKRNHDKNRFQQIKG